jgi:hypothetical protein
MERTARCDHMRDRLLLSLPRRGAAAARARPPMASRPEASKSKSKRTRAQTKKHGPLTPLLAHGLSPHALVPATCPSSHMPFPATRPCSHMPFQVMRPSSHTPLQHAARHGWYFSVSHRWSAWCFSTCSSLYFRLAPTNEADAFARVGIARFCPAIRTGTPIQARWLQKREVGYS